MGDDIENVLREAATEMLELPWLLNELTNMGVEAQPMLTVMTADSATFLADFLRPRIDGKIIVEIGGGIGLLSMAMSAFAKRVYCIEANPIWASVFSTIFEKSRPDNMTYLCGPASKFGGSFRSDLAVIVSHSGLASMRRAAKLFTDETAIDVWGELIERSPEHFDRFASMARNFA